MRLRMCAGLLALVASACAHIPEHLLVIVDGNRIEVTKTPVSAEGDTPDDEDAEDDEGE